MGIQLKYLRAMSKLLCFFILCSIFMVAQQMKGSGVGKKYPSFFKSLASKVIASSSTTIPKVSPEKEIKVQTSTTKKPSLKSLKWQKVDPKKKLQKQAQKLFKRLILLDSCYNKAQQSLTNTFSTHIFDLHIPKSIQSKVGKKFDYCANGKSCFFSKTDYDSALQLTKKCKCLKEDLKLDKQDGKQKIECIVPQNGVALKTTWLDGKPAKTSNVKYAQVKFVFSLTSEWVLLSGYPLA